MRRKIFAVKGKGSFPFELLAIDKCYPVDGKAAEAILLSCPTVTADEYTVVLETCNESSPHSNLWRHKKWPIQLIE